MQKSGRMIKWRRAAALLAAGLFVSMLAVLATQAVAYAADPPNQPFDLIYEETNVKHRVFLDGLGMLDSTEGTLANVDLGSEGIVKAYLVWAGLGRDDDGVLFERIGGDPATQVIAPAELTWNIDTFGQATWGCCGFELTSYAADITDLGIVTTGVNSYRLSDMEIEHVDGGQTVRENWGYSLLVIFEDSTLPKSRDIVVKLGNDGLFAYWTGLLGPNSDVQCFSFPQSDIERTATFAVIVGGVESELRPNSLWQLTGNSGFVDPTAERGTWTQNQGIIDVPPNIVGIGGGELIEGPLPPPFYDRNGNEWDEYPRFGIPVDTSDEWVCVQVESAAPENHPDLPPPGSGQGNDYIPASVGFLGFIAFLEPVDVPEIDIIKYTNGDDANDPDGTPVPVIAPGDPVTWTYDVTNTGTLTIAEEDIAVTDNVIGVITDIADKGDGDDQLAPGEVWTYVATGTALDLGNPPDDDNLVLVLDVCTQDGAVTTPSTAYTNVGTVTIPSMSAEDPSSYCNPLPEIDIVKYTNGADANDPDEAGVPVIAPDGAVAWTYEVTNVGAIDIPEADITVTDNVIGAITAIISKGDNDDVLAPGEVWLYQATGTALDLGNPPDDENLVLVPDVCTQGNVETPSSTAYTNVGTVTIPSMSAEDPSSYCGPLPEIDIIKYTNGLDANDPDAAGVPVIAPGDAVTWTYAVSNVGVVSIPEEDIAVTDNIFGAVTVIVDKGDDDDVLAPGEVWVYQATGVALDLANTTGGDGLQLVPGVCTQGNDETVPSTAYTNIGVVTIPSMSADDPSSYCGPPPSALDRDPEPTFNRIFIPLIAR